ncbi:Hypothetical protein KNT65_gp225 [Escherichia phage EcS1]|uniref:Uncharacterized protein n=1 Tax=Escherichia phage EcS1 TaxID=2083276 RepID=A0A2Z5ZC87_9CAUD|nr:Hypothetical protein KNT65_gp225 [Escherichia phage EcS1]BBC78268.1 Hypothetical protein [Escherichia phage EcS1]
MIATNLLAKRVFPPYDELFTEGKLYQIEKVSPNGAMALVLTDEGEYCHVNVAISNYGVFEVQYDA